MPNSMPKAEPVKLKNRADYEKKFKEVAQEYTNKYMFGPLNKEMETIIYEEIVKTSLAEPHKVKFTQNANKEFIVQLDGFSTPINLTELLTKVDFNHVSIPKSHVEMYVNKTDFHSQPILSETQEETFRKSKISNNISSDPNNDIERGELYAIRNYTNQEQCEKINGLMRGIPDSKNYKLGEIPQLLAHAAIASQGLNKLPNIQVGEQVAYFKRNQSTFGLDQLKNAAEKNAAGEIGGVVEFKGFVSSAYDSSTPSYFPDDVQIIFKNVVGKDVDGISFYPGENEYLIPPGQMRITGYQELTNGKVIVAAEGARVILDGKNMEIAGADPNIKKGQVKISGVGPNKGYTGPGVKVRFHDANERDLFVKQMIADGNKKGVDLSQMIEVPTAKNAVNAVYIKASPDKEGKYKIDWGDEDIAGVFVERLQLKKHTTVKKGVITFDESSITPKQTSNAIRSNFNLHATATYEAIKNLAKHKTSTAKASASSPADPGQQLKDAKKALKTAKMVDAGKKAVPGSQAPKLQETKEALKGVKPVAPDKKGAPLIAPKTVASPTTSVTLSSKVDKTVSPYPRITAEFKDNAERDNFVKQMTDEAKKHGVDISKMIELHPTKPGALYFKNEKETGVPELGVQVSSLSGKTKLKFGSQNVANIIQSRLSLGYDSALSKSGKSINFYPKTLTPSKSIKTTYHKQKNQNFSFDTYSF